MGNKFVEEEQEPFFEGAEKLLEIWFKQNGEDCGGDLRVIPQQQLKHLLRAAGCEIISHRSNQNVCSYLLSESSMFVWRDRFILKTCGNTTPLECVQQLVNMAKRYCGFLEIEKLFYSHKNFSQPHRQFSELYRDFQREVNFLDGCFGATGFTHCFPSVTNANDKWYLYVLFPPEYRNGNNNNNKNEENLNLDNIASLSPPRLSRKKEQDQTVEIAMSELDTSFMRVFSKKHSSSPEQVLQKIKITDFVPNLQIDHFLFEPNGYSLNGILPDGSYVTIHVTPEDQCSYVSFETNIAFVSYKKLVQQILELFQPRRFLLTLFANKVSIARNAPAEMKNLSTIGAWHQSDSDICEIGEYDLTVAFYSKFPS